MIEKKIHTRIVAVALLLFFTLPNPCRSQKNNEPSRWLKQTLANTRSVPVDEEELLNRDFSPVLADKRTDFIGYIGNDYHKMDICFHTVTKESDTSYRITGSSKIRTNVCTFSGSVRIPDSGDLDIGAAEFSVNPAYAANGWTEGANSSGRAGEHISEYSCMPPDAVNASYKVIGKEAGAYYCLSIKGKEHRTPDMMDYGDPDLKVYTQNGSTVLLVGLIDFYASVYFVYHFQEGVLTRLGQIDIEQPADVEEHGVRTVSFKVTRENGKLVVRSYLDDAGASKNEFPLNGLVNTEK